ncbi:FimV/HubP family polar landmark protein [Dyella sp. A6]|uniref:FimV/HubP family polar landmark protein n=1 Tax=Dyella aluminiiresistens TaxID=3069105 RepID=UPI002E795594|nr:FimV/HubP family polar landmark protein [Dyella sp. A6]
MNRSLKLSMLIALALGSSQAMALNLGQIQIKSALGQPLRVEIPVIPASPAELQNLSARLASNGAFARAGITDGKPSMPLQFSVTSDHGHKVILVTSSVPVNNPYIDLLIEVTSAAGTSVHEYPVLLDPPGEQMSAAPAAAKPRATHPHHAAAPVAARPAPAAHPAAAAPGQYGPVKSGQTLTAVARKVALSGVDINQMMLALKQANPDAFYQDNINALKTGAILRVPSREQALAVKVAEAAAAVRQQNSDWHAGKPTTIAAAATRTNATVSPTSTTSSGDRLALVPAGKGVGSGHAGHESTASLRRQLQRSQESLTSLQQQSADLSSRLKALQDINSKNKRLLSLKDSEIADLQAKLVAARKAAGLPAAKPVATTPVKAKTAPAAVANTVVTAPAAPTSAPASTTTPTPASSTALAGAKTVSAPATATSVAKPAATAPVAKPVAKKPMVSKPVMHPHHPAPAPEQPWYMQTWTRIAGAGVLVLGLLLLLVSRKRAGKGGSPASTKIAPSLADRFGDNPASSDATGGSDPDQDELLDQLAEHPDDIGLHLELVSLYYSRRDVEHFEAAAEAMHAHISGPQQDEWQDVVHMGEDLTPEHPLFAHAQAGTGHYETGHYEEEVVPPADDEPSNEALDDFGLNHYGEAPVEAAATGATPPPLRQKVSEYHFDFNLTPHAPEKGAAEASAAASGEPAHAEEAPEASGWHFDEPAEANPVEAHDTHAAHAAGAGADDDLGDFGELSEDPVDTKLDLARAYLDMGDPEGARAMLDEVMQEGSQMQREVAKGLLDKLA